VFLPDGTPFRQNLDPFGTASVDECRSILEAVRLWDFVESRGGLDASMSGDTLSQGQKQLFGLARAVLRRRMRPGSSMKPDGTRKQGGVLLLDEFSSSVDWETDKVMHVVIQSEFEGYTIVTVSHRLEMVMDFDRVVVMDQGRVVETGNPRALKAMEGSWFKELLSASK
jgi:ABC-type multidrug transport system fused ATPase/permease subunit